MQHVSTLQELDKAVPTAVALGVFDGVHLGHQALIRDMVAQAKQKGIRTAVMTFFPHPKVVLKGLSGRLYLTPISKRAQLLHALGVEIVVTNQFDEATRQITAEHYVDLMQTHLGMVEIWSGDILRFPVVCNQIQNLR
ncbi:MAG: hypothetical protein AAF633_06115, partial [Chloroflexota bacterium]